MTHMAMLYYAIVGGALALCILAGIIWFAREKLRRWREQSTGYSMPGVDALTEAALSQQERMRR